MKKNSVFVVMVLLLFSLAPLAFGANETTNTTDDSTTSANDDSTKIEKGFECLEEKVDDCSTLSTQELAFTILATPDNIFDECVNELEDRKSSDNWGNVRDTALAILALKHAGKSTTPSEEWLLTQTRTPKELTWYLQQDSNDATECKLLYDSKDYSINIDKNKKIDSNAGPCLTRAQSNFWLKIDDECYGKEISMSCDKDFITSLLYKNSRSSTLYVLEGTNSAPASGTTKISVNSKCFGNSKCEYEATAWATIALKQTGHEIDEFLPYIIATSDSNERYLPESFIYMLTNYNDYASQLISKQKLGNYWLADSSAYNRNYDTSLAIIALGKSSQEKTQKAADWLLFSQNANGCWQNSVRDTAMALWALAGKSGKSSGGGGTTYCSQANFFCIPSAECSGSNDVGNNYYCASLSDTCCKIDIQKTCSEYNGKVCSSGESCTGNEKKATDTPACCTAECVVKPKENECEANFYTCKSSCSDNQEETGDSCDGAGVCCKTKTSKSSSSALIWSLTIGIIVLLAIIGWFFRARLKLFWFGLTSKFKKDKGRGPGPRGPRPGYPPRPGPGYPPRPGFPPVRRPRAPVAPMRRPIKHDKDLSNTFQKLKDMSR